MTTIHCSWTGCRAPEPPGPANTPDQHVATLMHWKPGCAIADARRCRLRGGGQRGVGLTEVLVAMLVFAVGMLGLMIVQVNAKRANYEASQRALATALARDMLERMRSNPGQLAAYVRSDMGARLVPAEQPAVDCTAMTCSPAQLAVHDLWEWESMLTGGSAGAGTGGLVEPRACISHDAGQVEVAIAWLGVNAASNPDASACGESAAGLYDATSGAPGNNLRRRLLVMGSYIGRQL